MGVITVWCYLENSPFKGYYNTLLFKILANIIGDIFGVFVIFREEFRLKLSGFKGLVTEHIHKIYPLFGTA